MAIISERDFNKQLEVLIDGKSPAANEETIESLILYINENPESISSSNTRNLIKHALENILGRMKYNEDKE